MVANSARGGEVPLFERIHPLFWWFTR